MNEKDIGFGDYVVIEQHRYGVPNEMFLYKVVGYMKSNCYVTVPVHSVDGEKLQGEVVPVIACIRCGIDETKVQKFRLEDVSLAKQTTSKIKRLNEKVKWLEFGNETLVGFKEAALKEQEELQLYKDLYTKVNTQNMVYKMALKENIPILKSVLQVIKNQVEYDEGIALGGVIVQLEKALEVDTNE